MKRFRKVYLEISNVCNLKCAFCPGTKSKPRIMAENTFTAILGKLRPYTDFLYFHLMGEPLCHPNLQRYLQIAGDFGFRVILTTNGTLLPKQKEILLSSPALHKVNISLHAFEANDVSVPFQTYLEGCCDFGTAAQGKCIVCYRLWNHGGADALNAQIIQTLQAHFPEEWVTERHGTRIGERIYLENGDKFDWPDLTAPESDKRVFCYGMRDQIGILCDGTVVPCCLDHEGDIPLGNILQQPLEEILDSDRANAIYNGFLSGNAAEDLCRRCGYAQRFQK